MTRHNDILNKFKSILTAFDFTNKEHREVVRGLLSLCHMCSIQQWLKSQYKNSVSFTIECIASNCVLLCLQLMMILIKVSDISNEARPMEVAEPWLDCLLQEFYNQVPSPLDMCFNYGRLI